MGIIDETRVFSFGKGWCVAVLTMSSVETAGTIPNTAKHPRSSLVLPALSGLP